MKRFFLIFTAFIIFFSSVSHAKTYKIAVVPWMGWTPVHVAEIKGFWKPLGVDVRVFTVPTVQQVKALLLNGNIDISFDMIGNSIGYYMEGTPVVIIAETDWSHGGDKIIIKKGMSVPEIKGKPVGIYFNTPALTFFLNRYLNANGLTFSEVHLIEMEVADLANHFIGGRLQTIICYDPEARRAEREGNGRVIATSATYEGCIPEGMIMLEKVFLETPEKDLINFFKGWTLAVQWMNDQKNWDEYVSILNENVFSEDGPFSEPEIREMAAAVKIHNLAESFDRNKDGGGLYQYLTELKTFLKKNNMLAKDFSPDDIFNNQAVMKSLRLSRHGVKPSVEKEGAVEAE